MPKYWALEADVFEAGTSDLCGCIRKRFKDYLSDPDADGNMFTYDVCSHNTTYITN